MKSKVVYQNYSVNREKEFRYIIDLKEYEQLEQNGDIHVVFIQGIVQSWGKENNDGVRFRIRKTTNNESTFYEHTVKYPLSKETALEINENLTSIDYRSLRESGYFETEQKKIRKVIEFDGFEELNSNYFITADFLMPNPEVVFLEFERKNEDKKAFELPKILEGKVKKCDSLLNNQQ